MLCPISRTVNLRDEVPPCKGAIKRKVPFTQREGIPGWITRAMTPDHWDEAAVIAAYRPVIPGLFAHDTSYSYQFSWEDGVLYIDFTGEQTEWVIELSSLEDLIALCKRVDEELIVSVDAASNEVSLEIYDGYRE